MEPVLGIKIKNIGLMRLEGTLSPKLLNSKSANKSYWRYGK
jgi:hypothetical protein